MEREGRGRPDERVGVRVAGDDHSPLITWTIVQGQQRVGKREVKEERSAVLLRASLWVGRAVKRDERLCSRYCRLRYKNAGEQVEIYESNVTL